MTVAQVQTSDGIEFVVERWTCPHCGHVQSDTVHPILGPWFTSTCEKCSDSFADNSLDKESLSNWSDARQAAEVFRAAEQAAEERELARKSETNTRSRVQAIVSEWLSTVNAGRDGPLALADAEPLIDAIVAEVQKYKRITDC